MRVYEVVDDRERCSYLDNLYQQNHYKFVQGCTKSYCSDLIKRGWRRFGKMFFRPICTNCQECQSLRIDVENFIITDSIKKTVNRNKNTKIVIREPLVSNAHLELFDTYHLYMHHKKGWNFKSTTISNYYESFVTGHSDFGKEVAYYVDNKLVAIDFIDVLDDGISAIYFVYNPEYAKLSLGVYSIYKEIEFAKQIGLKWIYLGYYVKDNASLNYKSRYKPYEVLQGRPELNDEGVWIPHHNSI